MSDEQKATRRSSAPVGGRDDPRSARTREAVLAVLVASIRAGQDDVSVAEVCRRASVHRVTFYGHWPDIATAVAEAYAREVDRLAAIPAGVLESARTAADLATAYASALRDQLAEIREHRIAYRQLFLTGRGGFEAQLRESLESRAVEAITHLDALDGRPGRSVEIAAGYLAGGVAASYRQWALSDDGDLESMTSEILRQLPGWWPLPG